MLLLASGVAVAALLILGGPVAAEWVIARMDPGIDIALVELVYRIAIFGSMIMAAFAMAKLWRTPRPAAGTSLLVKGMASLGLGLAGLGIAVVLCALAGTVLPLRPPPLQLWVLLTGSALVIFSAVAEEFYFRGFLQPAMVGHLGPVGGIALTAAAFASIHILGGASNPVALLNLFLGGLFFGLLAWNQHGIFAASTAHAGWNWAENIGLGLVPNPGFGPYGALADIELVGHAWWGGSDDGLNDSIAMTIALASVIAITLTIIWLSYRRQRTRIGRTGGTPMHAETVRQMSSDPVR